MSIGVSSRQCLRTVAMFLVTVLLVQASPVPLLAASQPVIPQSATSQAGRGALDAVKKMVQQDLQILTTQGKEAYLDELFERLDQDAKLVMQFVVAAIDRIGAKKLAMLILGLGSPMLAVMIAAVPEPWVAAAIKLAINNFIKKAIRSIKSALVPMTQKILEMGLKKILTLLGNSQFQAGLAIKASVTDEETWWEKFFGNSTIVKNFIITIVAVGSIGVAIGLAIAGASAAPIVAVVGALVALIALLKTDDKLEAPLLALAR